jgi:outer membrane protein assembly factor BamB
VPGTDAAPGGAIAAANPVAAGKLTTGVGQPVNLSGTWPQFRGPNRDGVIPETGVPLSRDWKSNPPRELWSLEVGEGYSGVAVRGGRVYLLDYDRDAKQSALRCLSLADGGEIWRYSYPLTIKRNHGMTRTVPVVTDTFVIALDSKCNVFCLDAMSGELKWSVSLVGEFGATVPEWYAGQCPLVDGDKVILAPGGNDALLVALDVSTGNVHWRTPNPQDWKMTHSSIMPMDYLGRRQYVYCASRGVVGVDAQDGALLWETTDWKISIATVPSPLPLTDGRIFLTGGYGAGSLMVQLQERDGRLSLKTLFKLAPEIFGATQHTPMLKDNFIYATRADGRFVCLGLDGKVVWASSSADNFGLGSFLAAGDFIYALNDSGGLGLIEATPTRFNLLGQAKPLNGRESWAPMALAGGRLLLRDLTRLICLDVSTK